jgi:hypothetical protein
MGIDVRDMEKLINVVYEEVVVFENCQNAHIGKNAHYQKPLSPGSFSVLDHNAGYIVDNYRQEQDEYIDRNEVHIKYATGNQKMEPPEFMWQQKIKSRHNWKEEQKLK